MLDFLVALTAAGALTAGGMVVAMFLCARGELKQMTGEVPPYNQQKNRGY